MQTGAWDISSNSRAAAGILTSPFDPQYFTAMLNVAATVAQTPVATVYNCQRISVPVSLSSGFDSTEGPSLLFPLLQVADSPQKICIFLNLLTRATRGSPNAIYYMQYIGYRMVATMLHSKPRELITQDVLEACFQCSVDIRPAKHDEALALLLVDTAALYWLVLNHAVWGVDNESRGLHIMTMLTRLVNQDHSHAVLNGQRLTSLGCVAWCLHLMMRTANRKSSRAPKRMSSSKCANCNRPCYTDKDETDIDPMLSGCSTFLRSLMLAKVRQQDVEYIAQLLLYTNHHVYVVKASNQRQHDNDAPSKLSNAQVVHQAMLIRVHLLELLIQLLDTEDARISVTDGNVQKSRGLSVRSNPRDAQITDRVQLFAEAFAPRWFIHVFNTASDSSTVLVALRLLGLLLQESTSFRDTFCADNGFQVLAARIPEFVHEQAIIAILLALLFQVPVTQVPVLSAYEPGMLWFFLEKTPGPTIEDPMLSYFTLPVLNLIAESLSRNASFRRIEEILTEHEDCKVPIQNLAVQANTVLIAFLCLAYERCNGLRELLLERRGLGYLLLAILGCANTVVTKLLDADQSTGPLPDMCALIDEGYLSMDRLGELTHARTISSDGDIDSSKLDIDIHNDQAQQLLKILRKVFHDAVFVFRKPALLSWGMLSFPSFTVGSFCRGFQSLLIEVFNEVIDEVLISLDVYPLRGALESIVCLSGIATAGLLDDSVVNAILDQLLKTIGVIQNNHIVSSYGKEAQDELLSVALPITRYFAVLRYQLAKLSSENDMSAPQLIAALVWIRSNMTTLTIKVPVDD